MNKKLFAYFGVGIAAIAAILGVLWYYQSQGLIRIFPTAEDRQMAKILVIDESKFKPAEGMPEETFRGQIAKLYEQKKIVQKNPKDVQAWFSFGYLKEFLNDHEGAVAAWQKTLEIQPEHFVAAGNLGNVYQYFLKDYPNSERYYLAALQFKPEYNAAYQGLLDLYRFNWKAQESKFEPLALQAVQKDSVNAGSYLVSLIEFFASKKDLAKARTYLDQVRSVKPDAVNELLETYPELK